MTNFSGMKSSTRTFVVFIVLVSVIILPVQSFSQEGDPSTELEPQLVNDTTVDLVEPADVIDMVDSADVTATTVEPADVNATTIEPADVNATTVEPADVIDLADLAVVGNVTGAIQADEEEIPLMLIIAAVVAAAVIGGVIAYSKSRKRTTEKVATKNFCGKCGAAIDTNYKFCRKCGKSLPKK